MALLEAFDIWLDQPTSKKYAPGETITGRVVTKGYFEKNVKGLKLTFDGRAIVKWTEQKMEYQERSGDGRRVAIPISKAVSDSCNYFQFNRFLFGDGVAEVRLPAGENSYEFSLTIPPINLPASYATNFCTIEYVLEAKFKSCGAFDQYKARKMVAISPVVDLNANLTALAPGEWEIVKNYSFLCCTSGPVTMDVRTTKQGFVAGEAINLLLSIENMSDKDIQDISVELVQEDTYLAEGKSKKLRREHFRAKRGHPISGLTSETWQLVVQVPNNVPPTNLGSCQIATVQYYLEIKASVTRTFSNIFKSISIIIGTVPIGRSDPSQFSPELGAIASAPPPPYFSVCESGPSHSSGNGGLYMGYSNECYSSTTKLVA